MLAIDAAILRDWPTSGRRLRGGKGTVRTNYPKRAMNLIEVPGDGTLDLQFNEDL